MEMMSCGKQLGQFFKETSEKGGEYSSWQLSYICYNKIKGRLLFKENKPMATKILIVEDEQTLLKALTAKFEDEGYEVLTAVDGQTAVDSAKSNLPEIILLDIILPVKDGLAVLEELKSDPATRDIPVLLLTNLSDQNSISRGVELGAAGYIIKADFSLDEVAEKVKSVINQQPGGNQSAN